MRQRSSRFLWPVIFLYTAARILSVPSDPAVKGFGHDSAYIILVAQNLLDGRGYVNDAHWLVFLQPEELPIPYHNANPLYPTLIAALGWLTGQDLVWCGLAISAVASGWLFAALFFLVAPYAPRFDCRFLLAGAGTFFPAVFLDSLTLLPDALCLALTATSLACLVRSERRGMVLLAGLCLGLAWLTRSSVSLLAPAAIIFLWLRHGWQAGMTRLAVFALSGLVVISPWLLYMWHVWGHPLRSDASFYLLQDYHARGFEGSIERYWHSTQAPATAGELLRREPADFLTFFLGSWPRFGINALSGWTQGQRIVAVILALLILYAGWRGWSWWRRSADERRRYLPEIAAVIAMTVCLLLGFALRAQSLEIRYLGPISLLIAMGTMAASADISLIARRVALGHVKERGTEGAKDSAGEQARPRITVAMWTGVLLGAAFWLWVPYRDVVNQVNLARPDPQRESYFTLARQAALQVDHGPVVVGDYPYFFTLETGLPSLSIPQADDAWLHDYMKRYRARHVFLTREELAFWRPSWLTPGGLPNFLRKKAELGDALLFERTPP